LIDDPLFLKGCYINFYWSMDPLFCLHWSSDHQSLWRHLDRCRSGASGSAEQRAEAWSQDWKAPGRSSRECSLS